MISLAPEVLFQLFGIGITNTYVVASLIVLLFAGVVWYLHVKQLRMVPVGLQNGIEAVFELWMDQIDKVTNDRKQTLMFFPLVVGIFLYVLFSNLIELVPGLGSVGVWGLHHGHVALIPFVRSASADLNFTLGIAVVTMVATWVYGIREIGFSQHISKFFSFKNPITFFVGILEFIGEFAKIVSFSFRLFGNIFAGEVLLIVIAFLAPYIAGIPFLFLELFVGLVQALVFSMLALVFLKMAVTAHH